MHAMQSQSMRFGGSSQSATENHPALAIRWHVFLVGRRYCRRRCSFHHLASMAPRHSRKDSIGDRGQSTRFNAGEQQCNASSVETKFDNVNIFATNVNLFDAHGISNGSRIAIEHDGSRYNLHERSGASNSDAVPNGNSST
jgi:hypothetical protein